MLNNQEKIQCAKNVVKQINLNKADEIMFRYHIAQINQYQENKLFSGEIRELNGIYNCQKTIEIKD